MYEQSEYWRGVNNAKARQAWAVFLSSYTWDAFITCTARSPTLRKQPLGLLRRTLRSFIEDAPSPVSRLFLAAEEFKLGGWHAHGLVKWDMGIPVYELGKVSNVVSRRLSRIGYSRVEPAKSTDAVAGYLSKYVIKDNPWEWEIAGAGWAHIKNSL